MPTNDSSPNAAVKARARPDSSRPGTDSRRAAPISHSATRACATERPQVVAAPRASRLLRQPQQAGTPTSASRPKGSSHNARRAGGANGRTGRRSSRTAAASSDGTRSSAIAPPVSEPEGRPQRLHRPAGAQLGSTGADAQPLPDLLKAEAVDVVQQPDLAASRGQPAQCGLDVLGLDVCRCTLALEGRRRRIEVGSALLVAGPAPGQP